MNIAFVSDAIYPYNKGGKEMRLYELSTRLAARGHDVHIYCMHWWDSPEKDRMEEGVHLHAISKLYPLYAGERRSIKEGVMFGFACLRLLRAKFDVVDVDHMPFFPIFSVWLVTLLTFRHKKMHATWHEVWGRAYWVEYMGLLGNISAIIELISVRLPHSITAISSHTSELLKKNLFRSRNVIISNCGINFDHIQTVKAKSTKSDVVYAGRLLKHKNIDVLVKAISRLKKTRPNITCTIIGNGPEEDRLKKQVKNLGLKANVRFIDFLSKHDDVYAYIKASKVFCFPSEREGFGIVVLESIACDTPIIVSNSAANAARSLVAPDVSGSVVAAKPETIAEAIEVWLQKDIKPHSLSQMVSHYGWHELAQKQEEIYL